MNHAGPLPGGNAVSEGCDILTLKLYVRQIDISEGSITVLDFNEIWLKSRPGRRCVDLRCLLGWSIAFSLLLFTVKRTSVWGPQGSPLIVKMFVHGP